MSDNIDQYGNLRTAGYGQGLSEIAKAIAGSPKADAEAANFRNVSEANQIKLEDARRAAERDKGLDPHRKGLADLFKETETFGEGETVYPDGSGPSIVKKRAAFHWNGNRFEFDQDAVSKLVEHGVALYGPDFAKNWHGFLTNAAPKYDDIDPTHQPLATTSGRAAVPGGVRLSDSQTKNIEDNSIATAVSNAKAKGKAAEIEADNKTNLDLSHGIIRDPRTGGFRIGPKSPLGKLLSGFGVTKQEEEEADPETPSDNADESTGEPQPTVANVTQEEASGQQPPSPIFDLDTPVTKQYSADKKTASSSKVAEVISGGGKVVKNKDGSFSFNPAEPSREMNPSEIARDAANSQGVRSLPSQADINAKRKIDDEWSAGLAKRLVGSVADKEGDSPHPDLLGPIADVVNGVRIDLESRGIEPDQARSIAYDIVTKAYNQQFRTNWEMFGKNLIEKNPDAWDKDDKNVTPEFAAEAVKTKVSTDVNKVPNMYLDHEKYAKSSRNILDSLGVSPDLDYESDEKLKSMLVGIAWMQDVINNAPANGYRFSSPGKAGGKHIIHVMTDPANDIQKFQQRIDQMKEYIQNNYK